MDSQKISFGFKKTKTKFQNKPSNDLPEKEEREYIKGIEDRAIQSTKQLVSSKRMIPLINTKAEDRGIAKEPTLDDYMNTPVEEFGMAMIRGMGWKDEN